MRARAPIAEIALAVLGILFLTVFGVIRQERETPNLDTYSSYDARSGGYRAWYELLQREGLDVMRFERHWAFLDDSIATLVLALPLDDSALAGPASTPTGPPALAAWVERGGRLAILIPPDQGGIRRTFLAKYAGFAALRFHTAFYAGLRSGSVGEARMGRGKVVRITDEEAFTNGRIGSGDAAGAAYFAALSSRPGVVAFDETLHGYLVPEDWRQAAPRRLVFAIIGACVVLGIALFGAAIRLGPPILPPERREATSAEYLEAVASLYERAGARCKVLQDVTISVRRAAMRSGRLKNDVGEHAENAELQAALAELDALASVPAPTKSAFVGGVAAAYRLMKLV